MLCRLVPILKDKVIEETILPFAIKNYSSEDANELERWMEKQYVPGTTDDAYLPKILRLPFHHTCTA